MHLALSRQDHRPWPIPSTPWTWRQSWRQLLFAHWPVPAEQLRSLVPEQLEIQEFDGVSWIGVVPFSMAGVMRRPLPDLPYFSQFPELNLRLYVEYEGQPGVWFLSLDADNSAAVWAARRFFHLPYFKATMSSRPRGSRHVYSSKRAQSTGTVQFEAEYGPTGAVYESEPGTLEHWLTERYCLFAQAPNGSIYRAEVHHHPWPLQPAEAAIEENDLFVPHGLSIDGPPELLHYSERIDVVVWSPTRVC